MTSRRVSYRIHKSTSRRRPGWRHARSQSNSPLALFPHFRFVPVVSETVSLDRSDSSNLHCCGHFPSAKHRPMQARLRLAHERRPNIDDRAKPSDCVSSTASSDTGVGPPSERVQSGVAEYMDPPSTAKPAVSSTPNVPLSTSARAPLLSLAHFIPTTPSSARVPARTAPSHRVAHPAVFGYYSNTDDASMHLAATAAPLHGIMCAAPAPAPPHSKGVHRSWAPHAVFPRRTECPNSATPSAPVQAFSKSDRASTPPPNYETLETGTRPYIGC
ncbi:hypothetical protein DFH11DRAFT_1549243 [Phellopilus nigrolimitatus]|nr:hypothetical protein DFH11DRAFT_1549243 [Phellopilus nigrolimitatus]